MYSVTTVVVVQENADIGTFRFTSGNENSRDPDELLH